MTPLCRTAGSSISSVRLLSAIFSSLLVTLKTTPGSDSLKMISIPLKNHLIFNVVSTFSKLRINWQINLSLPPAFTSKAVSFEGKVRPALHNTLAQLQLASYVLNLT